MITNFKNLNIGAIVHQRVMELEMDIIRICNFFKCTQDEIESMYKSMSLNSEVLLRWSKLLQYDFFRPYTQHLILYSPPTSKKNDILTVKKESLLPQFKKNIYTKQMIDFILHQIETGDKTKSQIIEDYRIPKTTLYKWISKYKK